MVSEPPEAYVVVGVVLGAHGSDGRVPRADGDRQPRTVPSGAGASSRKSGPLVIERTQRAPDGALLVKFEGVTERDAAAALRGAELCVPAEETPQTPPDAYYHYQLIGSTS